MCSDHRADHQLNQPLQSSPPLLRLSPPSSLPFPAIPLSPLYVRLYPERDRTPQQLSNRRWECCPIGGVFRHSRREVLDCDVDEASKGPGLVVHSRRARSGSLHFALKKAGGKGRGAAETSHHRAQRVLVHADTASLVAGVVGGDPLGQGVVHKAEHVLAVRRSLPTRHRPSGPGTAEDVHMCRGGRRGGGGTS